QWAVFRQVVHRRTGAGTRSARRACAALARAARAARTTLVTVAVRAGAVASPPDGPAAQARPVNARDTAAAATVTLARRLVAVIIVGSRVLPGERPGPGGER